MLHPEQSARVFDVLRYLRLQRVDSGEAALLAQAMHELHAQPSPVDVLREVEQVDLEREERVPGGAGLGDFRTKGGIEPEVGRTRDGGPPGKRRARTAYTPTAGSSSFLVRMFAV